MSTPPQEQIERETRYAGKLFSVDVLSWRGADGKKISREIVRHPGAVLIVPMLDDDRVVMIRNRRVAVNDTLWEFPAGTAEPHEDPQRTAARELVEEAGYGASRIELLGTFYTSPGFSNELMRVYLAGDLTQVGQNLQPYEDIDVQVMPLARVRAMAAAGELVDGKSIAALFLLEQRLKREKTGAGGAGRNRRRRGSA